MTRQGLFYSQDHLPNVLPVVDVLVSCCALRKRKRLDYSDLDLPRAIHAEEFIKLAAQQGAAGRQSRKIHAHDGNVLAHQFERMKTRSLEERGEAAQPTPFSFRAGHGRKFVYYEAAGRTKTFVAAR